MLREEIKKSLNAKILSKTASLEGKNALTEISDIEKLEKELETKQERLRKSLIKEGYDMSGSAGYCPTCKRSY